MKSRAHTLLVISQKNTAARLKVTTSFKFSIIFRINLILSVLGEVEF